MPSDAKARRAANKKKAAINKKAALNGGAAEGGVSSGASSVNGDSTPGTPQLRSANSSSSKFIYLSIITITPQEHSDKLMYVC